MQTVKKSDYLSKENSNCLKAIFALLIMISHMFAYRKFGVNLGLGPVITAFGYLSVSVFLFFSGYGLTVSYINKGNAYFNGYLRKRVLPVYIINVFLIVLYSIFQIAIGYKLSVIQIVQSFFIGGTVVKYGWYIQLILLFYVLYLLAFNKSSIYKGIIKISGLIILFCIICAILKMHQTWYESSLAFILGAVWARNKAKFDLLFNNIKNYIAGIVSVFITFSICFVLGNAGILPLIIKIPVKMVSSVLFVLLVLLVTMKIRINFKPTEFLGNYFFEIYIFQGFIIVLFSEVLVINNILIYYLVCITCSILVAMIMHPVINWINQKVKGG